MADSIGRSRVSLSDRMVNKIEGPDLQTLAAMYDAEVRGPRTFEKLRYSLVLAPMGNGKTSWSMLLNSDLDAARRELVLQGDERGVLSPAWHYTWSAFDTDVAMHWSLKDRLKTLRRQGNWDEHNTIAFAAINGAMDAAMYSGNSFRYVFDHTGYFALSYRMRMAQLAAVYIIAAPVDVALKRIKVQRNDPSSTTEQLTRKNYQSIRNAVREFEKRGVEVTPLDWMVPFDVLGQPLIASSAQIKDYADFLEGK